MALAEAGAPLFTMRISALVQLEQLLFDRDEAEFHKQEQSGILAQNFSLCGKLLS